MDYAVQEFATHSLQYAFNLAAIASKMGAYNAHMMGMPDLGRDLDAAGTMYGRAGKNYPKPAFNLPTTQIDERSVPVTERITFKRPYCNLVHFERDTNRHDPKILVVAPMSGHYATLLRGTVEALLPHNDVYVTDWINARDVSPKHGRFGFADYVIYIEDFLHHLGPETHILAVCQPTVPVLAAVSLMARRDAPNQPLSMTLMGGPIDTRIAPTEVNRFAQKYSLSWFEDNCLSIVPHGHAAQGEKVYPGFKQLTGFMAMNWDKHVQAHKNMYNNLRTGDTKAAEKAASFYDEYLAVMDIPAKFYIETVDEVFQRHTLPKGEMTVHNQRVTPSSIQKTALFTVEGEKDDISAPGQTLTTHFLCNNIAPEQHFHYLQSGAGHYGIFEGRRWREEIAPRVSDFVRRAGEVNGLKYSEIPSNTRLMPPNFWQKTGGLTNPSFAVQ